MIAATCQRFDPAAVRVRLLRLFASDAYRPPRLPAVALELLALSRKEHPSFDEVVSLLERDPMLAAEVLSLCRSAALSRGSPVLSLRQAVVRLGLAGLRDVVLEAALHLRVFRAPGYEAPMARLSRHSTTVARLTPALCGRAGIDAEYAFLCGLLHDVGIAACLLALSDDRRAGAVAFEDVEPVVQEVHEEASGLLTRLWDLPAEIQRVAASHHHVVHGGTPSPVNAAVVLADELAWEVGAGVSPRGARERALDASAPEVVVAARAALRVDDAAWAVLLAEAAEIAARVQAG